jgi:ABC-type uncharacterized transport system substrate-binding protein
MVRASLLVFCASLALAAPSVWAHPHGSASCTVNVAYNGTSIAKVNVTLELDAENSNKVFESMQTKPDGTFTPEQKSRMESNLAFLFSPINYLVSLKANQAGATTPLALRASSMPEIERSSNARLRITTQLTRTDRAQANENDVVVSCADPTWYWLVGFKGTEQVTSNRLCVAKLGENFVFALPTNLPSLDGPSLKVTSDHLPKAQQVSLVCS